MCFAPKLNKNFLKLKADVKSYSGLIKPTMLEPRIFSDNFFLIILKALS